MKKFVKNTFRFIGAVFSLIRGIMVLGMLVMAAASVYFINMAYKVTIDQYEESLVWKDTAYEKPLAEVEPVLVSNIVDTDIVAAASAWDTLNQYVGGLDGSGLQDKENAKMLLDNAAHWQDVYNLRSDAVTRLSLYLELEDAIPDAYVTLDTGALEGLADRLYALELEMPTASGKQYMERLGEVSADFKKAKALMADTVLSAGSLKDGTWTVPYTYTEKDIAKVLGQLQAVEKFPDIRSTINVLSDVADVLNYNKNARDYFKYQEFKKSVLGKTSRSKYRPVSSIYTYAQALDFGCDILAEERDGYTISPDSILNGIYYKGERLSGNDYVKKGTLLTAIVNEIYEPIPIEEPSVPVEEPWEEDVPEEEASEETPSEEIPSDGAPVEGGLPEDAPTEEGLPPEGMGQPEEGADNYE